MAAVDHLSALPDDLLRRILSFVPAKEGASTAVLSRRWRSMWRSSGAVNLEWRMGRIYRPAPDYREKITRAFFRGARSALAAVHAHSTKVRRFSLHVEAENHSPIGQSLTRRRIRSVLSNPAIQRVEELRISAAGTHDKLVLIMLPDTREFYRLSFGALPSQALRVLHIVNCCHLKPPNSRATFPSLTDLHLQGCIFSLTSGLQRVVDAAPRLATLHLQSFSFSRGDSATPPCYRILLPTVTTFVLQDWPEMQGNLELDAPRLRHLAYEGFVQRRQRLSSLHASTKLVQVDLHLALPTMSMNWSIPVWFWQLVQNFSITKVLSLKLDFPVDLVAVVDDKGQDEVLRNCLFGNLEQLELDVQYHPKKETTAATALANFLHCCPVIRDLRLKLKQAMPTCYLSDTQVAQLDFDKSVSHFRGYKNGSMGGDCYHYGNCDIISDIPSLAKYSFTCLRSHLRRLSLRFWMDEPNCFGVQLALFFIERAMVLEEISIDDGSQKMCDHVNHKIERWIHDAAKRKKTKSPTYNMISTSI